MRRFKIVALLIGLAFISLDLTNAASNDVSIESFMALSKKLEEAVSARDFHKAREVVDELLPLMKDDIKNSKKVLSALKKEENPPIAEEEYKKMHNRKIELYDSIKHLIELSSAALRVKSTLIVDEVDEFINLMGKTSMDS